MMVRLFGCLLMMVSLFGCWNMSCVSLSTEILKKLRSVERRSTNCRPKAVNCSYGKGQVKTPWNVVILFFGCDFEGNAHFTFVKAGYYQNRR